MLVITPDKLVVPAPVITLALVPAFKLRVPVFETPFVADIFEALVVIVPLFVIVSVADIKAELVKVPALVTSV